MNLVISPFCCDFLSSLWIDWYWFSTAMDVVLLEALHLNSTSYVVVELLEIKIFCLYSVQNIYHICCFVYFWSYLGSIPFVLIFPFSFFFLVIFSAFSVFFFFVSLLLSLWIFKKQKDECCSIHFRVTLTHKVFQAWFRQRWLQAFLRVHFR